MSANSKLSQLAAINEYNSDADRFLITRRNGRADLIATALRLST